MNRLSRTLMLLTISSGIAMTACAHSPDHKKAPRAERMANMQAQQAALFKQADANRDGKLSSSEFAQLDVLRKEARAAKKAEFEKNRFAHLDSNKDGAISLDELEKKHDKRGKKMRHDKERPAAQS